MTIHRVVAMIAVSLPALLSETATFASARHAVAVPARTAPSSSVAPWAEFDALLRAVVRPTGVDYEALRGRLSELQSIHARLGSIGPRSTPDAYPSDDARKAYWLNVYNATVLLGVATAPPTMRNVLTMVPNGGFFHTRVWRIDGRELTLDQIENREVREVFHDARVHMALNCGARSCPPMRNEAYVPARLDAQLDEQTTRYVNRAGSVVLDPAAHRVTLSQLFEWFASDFATPVPRHPALGVTGPLEFVYTFADAPLRQRLVASCGAGARDCSQAFRPYDWTLNSAN